MDNPPSELVGAICGAFSSLFFMPMINKHPIAILAGMALGAGLGQSIATVVDNKAPAGGSLLDYFINKKPTIQKEE